MINNINDIATTPVFFLFIAFTFLLTYGYFRGRRQNINLYLSAFNDLVQVVKPDDQTYTTIGGIVGYHANLNVRKQSPISQVDATITMLPRHSWLYLPVSKLIMRYDRLFITLYLKQRLPGEGHLIEANYAGFRGPKITNAHRLERENIKWGNKDFYLYYETIIVRDHFLRFIDQNPAPGIIRHIALVPEERKGFVFMIPRRGQVKECFEPVFQWILSILKK
jgi:hypothetical protein